MQRRRLVQRVMDELKPVNASVAYPDHPLLLRGPDILAVNQGLLTAYFVYNGVGPRPTSRHELSRFLLTRLALPPGTTCALVVDGPETSGFAPHDLLLDAILDPREVSRFSRSGMSEGASASATAIEEVRGFHNARFAEAWAQEFDVPNEVRVRPERPGEPTSMVAARRSYFRPRDWMGVDNGVIYARLPSTMGVRARSAVEQIAVAATALDYNLGLGLSGINETAFRLRSRRGHLATHVLAGDRGVRAPRFDALKSQRAAAFAGIELANAQGAA